MARIKYAPNVAPLFNGNRGFTFMPNPVGQSAKTNAKTRHFRSPAQLDRMRDHTAIARTWSHLSDLERNNWQDWVDYLPQPCNRSTSGNLAAYQNYQKRNFYKSIAEGSNFSLMSEPRLITYEADPVIFKCNILNGSIFLHWSFSRSVGDLIFSLFIAAPISKAVNVTRSLDRYLFSIPSISGSQDITPWFVSTFGRIPVIGDQLLIRSIAAGIDNGQFIFIPLQKISVSGAQHIRFGYLYNKFCALDSRLINPVGWHLMTYADLQTIINAAGGESIAGGKLKSIGFDYWAEPNTAAVDSLGFHLRGSGWCRGSGDPAGEFFEQIFVYGFLWLLDYDSILFSMTWSGYASHGSGFNEQWGFAMRFVKDSTELLEGQSGSVVGNNGQFYKTVAIGGLEIMSENSVETKFQNGDMIGFYEDNYQWLEASSPLMTAYNQDLNFVWE